MGVSFLPDSRFERFTSHVSKNLASYFSVPLHSRKHRRFTRAASPLADSPAARLTSSIGFVAFNCPCQLREIYIWGHCKANPIHQEQRGFVADLTVPLAPLSPPA